MASRLGGVLGHIRMLMDRRRADAQSDGSLLERFRTQQDEEAFAALVQRHGPLVLGVCLRTLGDAHDAEDAFQVTFLALARQARTLRRCQALGGWLYSVAFRVALRAKARAARQRRSDREVVTMASSDPSAEASWRELGPVLDQELARLPEKLRAPVVLCCLQGKTDQEAAQELGWPTGSISKRLARGRDILRQRLARRGFVLSAAGLATLAAEYAPASVPAGLARSTVQTALVFSAGGAAAAGTLSISVAALLKATLRAMLLAKLKTPVTVVLVAALLGLLAGVGARWAAVAEPAGDRAAETPPVKEAPTPGVVEEKRPRTDPDGDLLPDGALARLGSLRLQHAGNLSYTIPPAITFSPDNKTLASVLQGGNVYLWDTGTGNKRSLLSKRTDYIARPVFSPDSKTVATVIVGEKDSRFNGTISLWDVDSGKVIRQLEGTPTGVSSLSFSADGQTLALGSWGNRTGPFTIYLRESATGKEIGQLAGHQSPVRCCAFSPDGQTLASACSYDLGGTKLDQTIRLWDVTAGKEIRQIPIPKTPASFVAFSPDGKLVAARVADAMRLWQTATGKELQAPAEDDRAVRQWWEQITSEQLRAFAKQHANDAPDRNSAVVFSPDGKIAATTKGSSTTRIRLWDVASGKEIRTADGHADIVHSVVFSPDGKTLASTSEDGTAILWDPATGRMRRSIEIGGRAVSAAFSPDGKSLAALDNLGWDGGRHLGSTLRLLDPATGRKLQQLQASPHAVLSPDWKYLAKEDGGTVRLLELASGKEIRSYVSRPGARVGSIAFSADGKLLGCVASYPHPMPKPNLSGQRASAVSLWEVDTGKAVPLTCMDVDAGVHELAFSPDGRILAGVGGKIRLWDRSTGKELPQFKEVLSRAAHLAFAPDSRTLATAEYRDIRLWETVTGKERRRFQGHLLNVRSVTFSADGQRLASGSDDGTALIWDVYGPRAARNWTAKELEAAWDDLAGADAARPFDAIVAMSCTSKETLAWLRPRLQPVRADQRVAQLITDLGSNEFATRQKAVEGLEKLAELAEAALLELLAGQPALDTRQRAERLLDKLQASPVTAETLRGVRAVEILERIGTAEAREILESLAKGVPGARLTREAKASVDRLAKRSAKQP